MTRRGEAERPSQTDWQMIMSRLAEIADHLRQNRTVMAYEMLRQVQEFAEYRSKQ